jgi:hypothetical protein
VAEVKSRSEIWLSVLEDLGDMCSVSTQADAEYMRRRVAAEGDGFFTVTLPSFGKQFERALADEVLSVDAFKGFKRRRIMVNTVSGSTESFTTLPSGVPLFLGGFMEKLFGMPDVPVFFPSYSPCLHGDGEPTINLGCKLLPSGGKLAEQADAVFAIRQLCLLFSKEKAMAPAMAQRAAIRQYIEVDQELDAPLG